MIWLAVPAAAAGAYYGLACVAAAQRGAGAGGRGSGEGRAPRGISILKPVHGRDPHFYDAIQTHAGQDYPEFEILFGVSDPSDSAIEDIERLKRNFPVIPISLHVIRTAAPNRKAGVLAELAKRAQHPVLLINDSDIRVPQGYLHAVAAPLEENGVGLVTCLYRAAGESTAARWEALGIATEFAPSVLVARLLGVAEFAMGSTMALKAATLREIGGFEAIEDYLADDYQLGAHINRKGYRIEFPPTVVETHLGAGTWSEVWRHQVRWSRTIRVSRPSGYFGYVVTHATLWALVAFAGGQWIAGAAALALRMMAGVWIGAGVLEDENVVRRCWLIPFRDMLGFAVWVAGLFGNTVEWRGQRLQLRSDGKITPAKAQRPQE
ncbi:MAG TPA: bacteriohopanetetrol glucosamine biosynthesis glycosyltransferase HpnI [Bryobacteraceae bacterium]|nr:bacteriohopanetetrol glucosamine biosynthesis glycosyltransferase HpnI [Bryobacteraceae bacterium]